MTTLFLLVTVVCQSLNELGVASVTKKWSGQNRPAGPLATALSNKELSLEEHYHCCWQTRQQAESLQNSGRSECEELRLRRRFAISVQSNVLCKL